MNIIEKILFCMCIIVLLSIAIINLDDAIKEKDLTDIVLDLFVVLVILLPSVYYLM